MSHHRHPCRCAGECLGVQRTDEYCVGEDAFNSLYGAPLLKPELLDEADLAAMDAAEKEVSG